MPLRFTLLINRRIFFSVGGAFSLSVSTLLNHSRVRNRLRPTADGGDWCRCCCTTNCARALCLWNYPNSNYSTTSICRRPRWLLGRLFVTNDYSHTLRRVTNDRLQCRSQRRYCCRGEQWFAWVRAMIIYCICVAYCVIAKGRINTASWLRDYYISVIR